MNEWMFNDTPAQKTNQLLGVKQMVFKYGNYMVNKNLNGKYGYIKLKWNKKVELFFAYKKEEKIIFNDTLNTFFNNYMTNIL